MEKDPFDIAKNIRPVPAPDFLLTRIYAKIEQRGMELTTLGFTWSVVVSFALVLLLNVLAILGQQSDNGGPKKGEFGYLQTSNQLYSE